MHDLQKRLLARGLTPIAYNFALAVYLKDFTTIGQIFQAMEADPNFSTARYRGGYVAYWPSIAYTEPKTYTFDGLLGFQEVALARLESGQGPSSLGDFREAREAFRTEVIETLDKAHQVAQDAWREGPNPIQAEALKATMARIKALTDRFLKD